MSAVIETKNLTKYYGKSRGIIDVNLSVEEGEIFGFIGPNGAGKSTTIRTLLSLIYKTSGEAKIFGLDSEASKVEILHNVGYLPSEVFYYDNMRAIDLFRYSASFYTKDCSQRIEELSSLLQVNLKQKIEDMSLGNKKKVGIIQGLLHSPRLIILDEPTSGLDPLMQKTFFDLIREENKRGATVLFSSHILSEVQRICDRVAIIKEGKIVAVQKIGEMKENAYKNVTFTVLSGSVPKDFTIEGAQHMEITDTGASFIYKGNVNLLLSEIAKYPLANIDIMEPPLEDIFMHYYAG
jgi:ABC-2 type transport system ATP-binding protein